MKVGDLFIGLGIKGSDKTVAALGNVTKNLGDAKSMSLEAKAGILAVVYGLERLMTQSAQAGTGLVNFNALTGTSTKVLQQYQYAGRQMGITNGEVSASFKTLQDLMTKTLIHGQAPAGLARLATLTGDIGNRQILEFQQHPERLIQRFQEYSKKEKNLGLRNEVLKSFGMGDAMSAGIARDAFNPKALARAPIYGDKEAGQLDKVNIAWSNLGTKIEMAMGHFTAKHGMQLVGDISKITDSVLKLTDAFQGLAEKLKLFETVGHVFEGIANTVKLVGEVADVVQGKKPKKGDLLYNDPTAQKPGEMFYKNEAVPKSDKVLEDFIGQRKQKPSAMSRLLGGLFGGPSIETAPSANRKIPIPAGSTTYSPIAPPMAKHAPSGSTQTISVKQDLHFQHDGKDHVKTGHSVKKAVQDAYRQIPQGRAS